MIIRKYSECCYRIKEYINIFFNADLIFTILPLCIIVFIKFTINPYNFDYNEEILTSPELSFASTTILGLTIRRRVKLSVKYSKKLNNLHDGNIMILTILTIISVILLSFFTLKKEGAYDF